MHGVAKVMLSLAIRWKDGWMDVFRTATTYHAAGGKRASSSRGRGFRFWLDHFAPHGLPMAPIKTLLLGPTLFLNLRF
jgi:hypothetical protein